MQLKTILNRVEKHKSFVYGKVRLSLKGGRLSLVVSLRPRRGSRPVCVGCGRRGPQMQTFSNQCEAEGAGYRVVADGPC